ncbi:hypothetical protein M422DRAFT_32219 [Sphaerobolus stellatus SS14]|uniref:Uncharacterized protein n=1 Tax=Sphaerobolus stellatus (strain SS14) TaxID=990650 RepID=A0A0C9VGN3_SPHS4|nr:hypothetical protein M422DRAFT_32219 [Sphaerobolus stellatus SS14]
MSRHEYRIVSLISEEYAVGSTFDFNRVLSPALLRSHERFIGVLIIKPVLMYILPVSFYYQSTRCVW